MNTENEIFIIFFRKAAMQKDVLMEFELKYSTKQQELCLPLITKYTVPHYY